MINLKGLNQLFVKETLQDGGSPSSPNSPLAGRLDGQNGPEGCIPPGANPPRPSVISLGEILQVHMPSIQPLICTKSFHQANFDNYQVSANLTPRAVSANSLTV